MLAGLTRLKSSGDFADGVIAFESDLLGGTEFVSFDHQAAQSTKTQGSVAGAVKQKMLKSMIGRFADAGAGAHHALVMGG
ncbi:MAG: hypothetical protein Q8O85_00580 [Rhodoferax sp.]|uniref:hypothetical protein n=1 Tax=Rhodoferax sp. TaxID=50421 RepID=UPI00273750F9|nr:hypothetical protein [Rhodoferax sp.]MDP2677202.1 hypothetical protein [Rhodoferax sp.]